jgi:hypothetical protein
LFNGFDIYFIWCDALHSEFKGCQMIFSILLVYCKRILNLQLPRCKENPWNVCHMGWKCKQEFTSQVCSHKRKSYLFRTFQLRHDWRRWEKNDTEVICCPNNISKLSGMCVSLLCLITMSFCSFHLQPA